MNISNFVVEKSGDLTTIVESLLNYHDNSKIITLFGDLGSGKTTFVQYFCKQLGVSDDVTSPTFSLINEYSTQTGKKIFHMDLYRLKNEQEAIDIGIEEYLLSGSYCLIEWPEKILNLLQGEYVEVHIQAEGIHRKISIQS